MVALFETERLVFRPYKASDLQKLSALLADPEVMQFYPEPYSFERSEKRLCAIQDMMEHVGYSFNAVYDRATDEYIGSLGLSQPRFTLGFGRFVEIGWVFHKHYWGRGLASEGARGCLAYGFEQLGLTDIYAFTARLNRPSERVMNKTNMQYIKGFDHPNLEQSHPLCPHLLYHIKKPTRILGE